MDFNQVAYMIWVLMSFHFVGFVILSLKFIQLVKLLEKMQYRSDTLDAMEEARSNKTTPVKFEDF